jgi:PhnB protein
MTTGSTTPTVADRPAVDPVPADYPTVVPYVVARGAARFMDFVVEVLGATERARFVNEDGTIGHGELEVGTSVILTFDAHGDWPDTPAFLSIYVEDCDAVHRRALEARRGRDHPAGYDLLRRPRRPLP